MRGAKGESNLSGAAEFDPEPLLATLTSRPGVYRMLDAAGTVIYVGKARNLRNRVTSYFRKGINEIKTAAMVRQIADVQVTVTNTETEALLLPEIVRPEASRSRTTIW